MVRKNLKFVAAWTAKTGNSISVLAIEETPNFLALTTGKGSSKRTAIQTFSKDRLSMLNLPQEVLDAIPDATCETPVEFPSSICVHEVFGMNCKIQIIEALGEDEALKLRILSRNKQTGVIMGQKSNLKRHRITLEPVVIQGKRVYRNSLIVPDTADYQDIFVTAVTPSTPTLPETGEAEDDDAAEEVF